MNILFVNYGDFTSNSLNHIGTFANQLTLLGHACVVAVPDNPESIGAVHEPLFTPVTFARALESEPIFPDRRPADIVHAWTPRENVREFTLSYLRRAPAAALIVHLEDNESFLLESFAHEPIEKLRRMSDEELASRLSPRLSHPIRFRSFLRLAHGVSYITDRLREFVPAAKLAHRLLPGIDPAVYRPLPPDPVRRRKLKLKKDEKLVVFTGSTTFANLADVRALILAIRQINDRGTPCRLVRTGINPPPLATETAKLGGKHVLDLGFVAKTELAPLLALADALVQPGTADDFNDYRLPSKIPEYLSVGKPVIIPAANLAREMKDGENALLLATGTPGEIADKCLQVFGDPELAARLSAGALEFARTHFDLVANTAGLLQFYLQVKSAATPIFADPDLPPSEDVLLAEGDLALRMRAKEQTIAATRRVVGERDAELGALRAASAHQHETIVTLQAATVELRTGIKDQQAVIQELQGSVRNLNTVIADLRTQQAAVVAERDGLAGHFETEKAALAARFDAEKSAMLALFKNEKEPFAASMESRQQAVCETCKAEQSAAVIQLRQERDTIFARFNAEKAALRDELERHRALETARSSYQDARIQDARRQVEVLRGQLVDALNVAEHFRREIDATTARTDEIMAVVRQREEKIGRMTRSFSWHVTSPLRALRRLWVDPIANRMAAAAAARPPVLDASIAFVIDEPADWNNVAPTGQLRGWVYSRDGEALCGVRARVGEHYLNGDWGLTRLDVAAAHPEQPHALHSGFVLTYSLPPGSTHRLRLEALTEDGKWRCFAAYTVRVGTPAPQHLGQDYTAWVTRFDTLTPELVVAYRDNIEAIPTDKRPLISVVMPVFNTSEKWLSKAIESVRAQLYPKWELCIADDASSAPHVRTLLEDFARRDERIKVTYREENGHISAASNSALALATGDFVALLDHDDELAPHALAEVVTLTAREPEADIIYSDEDKIDELGRRYNPYFKPDFLPDLITAQNFTSHLSVYRLALVREAGGFREGYEGSQDWDLALRVMDLTTPERIRHIPKILYHWRAIPGSTALALGEKNYPMIAAQKALTDHFTRRGETVELIRQAGDYWRVKRPLPAPPPLVSLVIPTRNRVDLLSRCIGSLLAKTTYPRFEITIVDNGSDDPETLEYFDKLRSAGIHILRYDAPFNFSAINNLAARHTPGEILGFLNNDVEVINPDWLDEMVSQAVRREIGCVGAMLYYPDDTIQHAGTILGVGGVANHAYYHAPRSTCHHFNRAHLVQNYSAVTAACLLIRREVFAAVDGFNEKDLAIAFNDVDFCLRVRAAGFWNLWTPFAEFYHHESPSRGQEDTPEKLARFHREVAYMRRTWGRELDRDPAYNPNLTLERPDFSLAFPPRQ